MKGSSGKIAAGMLLLCWSQVSVAQLAISQMIVDMKDGARTTDIEIVNQGDEDAYVAIEPREILNAGKPSEKPFTDPDPRKLGMLVSANRLVLAPKQRRLLRIANLSGAPAAERVYRVTVKPVAGPLVSSETGLKVMVGYDMLVLVRPAAIPELNIEARRSQGELVLTNRNSYSVEMSDPQLCVGASNCVKLPGKRLYPGATWTLKASANAKLNVEAHTPKEVRRLTL